MNAKFDCAFCKCHVFIKNIKRLKIIQTKTVLDWDFYLLKKTNLK